MKRNNINKIIIVMITFLGLIFSGYSLNGTLITDCNSLQNGQTYIIDNTFIGNSCNLNSNNTIITTNQFNINKLINFQVVGVNNTINNYKSTELTFTLPFNTNLNFTIKNSNILDMKSSIFFYVSSNVFSTQTYKNLNLINNTFQTKKNINFMSFIYTQFQTPNNAIILNNFYIVNNDFIGFNKFINNVGQYFNTAVNFDLNNKFDNNNLLIKNLGFTVTNLCDFSFNGNYLGWINNIDTNMDFIGDNIFTLSSGTCTYYNSFPNVKTILKDNSQSYNYLANSPNYYESNKRIFLSTSKDLDGLNTGIDLSNVVGTTINLSLLPGLNALRLGNVKAIKMGNNNNIYGGDGLKPIITTYQPIITNYNNVGGVDYINNYHLIEYFNNLEINNIDFELNNGDYSLIRKLNANTDGINLKLLNNKFNLLFTPLNVGMPLISSGCNLVAKNNEFFLFNTNISVFADGRCVGNSGTIAGGFIVQNNTFKNGGWIFQNLITGSSSNLKNLFNYNFFNRNNINDVYSLPFSPNNAQQTNLRNVTMDGDYYYKTTCQSYKFNLGNSFGFWNLNPGLNLTNDINNDKIFDLGNIGGFPSPAFLGFDFFGNNILDNRVLGQFPYPFSTQIANAVSTTNTCGSISFNILSPTPNQVLPSSTSFDSNWEFNSNTYSNMFCKENLNGVEIQYTGVNNGINKGATYSVTDGIGNFQVICGNTINYDDFVVSSPIINFQIGSSINPIIVGNNPIINPNPTTPNPNINQTTPNNNQTTPNNINQYTNLDVIDFNSVQNTNENTIGFMGDIMSFITSVGVPLGILIVIIVSFLAILRLIF